MACSCQDPAKKAAREERRQKQALARQQQREQRQAQAQQKVVKQNA